MAPAEPLNSAWVAVNRIDAEGQVRGEQERLTPYQALEAITINAAWVLGRESDVGSIRAGKKADFAILEADPLEVPSEQLKDIAILGTMFEGTHYPIES
jgi:predicted amidohydrolase YtcJ